MEFTLKTSIQKQIDRFSIAQNIVYAYAEHVQEKNLNNGAAVAALQYFALPIDCALQAITMPFTATVDHFKDISANIKKKQRTRAVIKAVASVVTLPLKLIASLAISLAFALNGAIQLVLPFHAAYSVHKVLDGAVNPFPFSYQQQAIGVGAILDGLERSKFSLLIL